MNHVGKLLVASLLCSAAPLLAQAEDNPQLSVFDLSAELGDGPRLTLQETSERVVEKAPSLARAQALSQAAEAALLRTRDQLIPKLELSARYTHIDGFPDGRISPPFPGAQPISIKIPRDQYGLSARLSWPVSDLFFAVAPAIKSARAGERARAAQQESEQARVKLSAVEAYYRLAHARGGLAVAQRALEQAEMQKQRIDAAVNAGLRPAAEASTAAARVAAAVQLVSSAEVGVEVANASLRALLELGEGPAFAVELPALEASVDETLPSATELLKKAHAQRAELRALRESLSAQRQTIRSVDASGYPHLSVYTGADYGRPNRYVIPPRDEFKPSWEAGALLSYSPNDTLNAHRRHHEAQASISSLEADLRELTRALTVEVHKCRATLLRSRRNMEAAAAAQKAAQDAYERRMAELRAGEVTLADLFLAESELNSARLNVLEAAIDQHLSKARLAYAVGDPSY